MKLMINNFKKLIVLQLGLFFVTCSLNAGQEIKDSNKSNEIISTNVDFLKAQIVNKIEATELKKEKYKEELKNCETGAEAQKLLKKIQKMENEIKNLNDSLIAFALVENKVK